MIAVSDGTGGGETDPATADGQVAGNSPPKLKTSALVSFPETECTDYYVPAAEASYAGAVAGFVAGLVQVNVRGPESLPDGNWLLELRLEALRGGDTVITDRGSLNSAIVCTGNVLSVPAAQRLRSALQSRELNPRHRKAPS